MSPKRHYLQPVKGWFRYRRRWPKSVSAVAAGQFLIRHLNITSFQEAAQMRPMLVSERGGWMRLPGH